MKAIRINKAVAAGCLLCAVAAAFAYGALQLKLGSAQRMGPGYFPLALAGILAALGLATLLGGLRQPGLAEIVVPWRALICIASGIGFFALTVRGLGLGPTMTGTVFMVAMADRRNTPLSALSIGPFMALFCWLVFKLGLGIVLPLFGPWLGGY